MNALQENTLSMYFTVQELLNLNSDIWKANKPFSTMYEKFKALMPLIAQYREAQNLNNTGLTQVKNEKKNELIEKAYYVANRMQSYASQTKNMELKARVKYEYSDFQRYRDTNLSGLCNTIHDLAKEQLAELADYDVTEDLLNELKKAIEVYNEQLSRPRTSKTGSKTATILLEQTFAEANAILKENLDVDMEVFRKSHPDFYEQYFLARRMVQSNSLRLALRIHVKEAGSGIPLANVLIGLNGGKEKKKSSEKGNCQVKNLAQGSYVLSFEKAGYQSQSLKINIIDGETTLVNVEMVKE